MSDGVNITSYISVTMSQTKCPCCRRTPQDPVNLRCEHHPCYQCCQPLVAIHSQSSLQTKYKICCPACSKKTVFYDIRHLILPNHANEEEEFATDKFLNKPQLKPHQVRQDNYVSVEHTSQPMTRRGSIQSIANANQSKAFLEIRCFQHGQPYKYFCCDCSQKHSKNSLLCCQCAKPHYNDSHKLLSLRQSEQKLANLNLRSKQQMVSRQGELSYLLDYLNHNKSIVDDYFSKMQQNLSKQFNTIFTILQEKYNSLRSDLKAKYEENLREISGKIQKLGSQQKVLQSLKDIPLKDMETNVKFYQTYDKFTASYPLSNFRSEIQLDKLPQLQKQYDLGGKIAEDWIALRCGPREELTSQKKSRKPSSFEEQLSHRSGREKQNQKMGLSPSFKTNNRKLLA